MVMKNESTPDWDSWYSETHGGTNKASWELDDEEIPDYDKDENEE